MVCGCLSVISSLSMFSDIYLKRRQEEKLNKKEKLESGSESAVVSFETSV